MVVGGDHSCQPAEGGHEDVEADGVGFDKELDACAEEGDLVSEVGWAEAEGDGVLVLERLRDSAEVEGVGDGVGVAGLAAGLTLGRA